MILVSENNSYSRQICFGFNDIAVESEISLAVYMYETVLGFAYFSTCK